MIQHPEDRAGIRGIRAHNIRARIFDETEWFAVGKSIVFFYLCHFTPSSERDFTLAFIIRRRKFIKNSQMQMERANFGKIGSRLTALSVGYVKLRADAVMGALIRWLLCKLSIRLMDSNESLEAIFS